MPDSRKQQEATLESLIRRAAHTTFGREHAFSEITTYEQFTRQVPVHSYEDIVPGIEALKKGSDNLFWPEKIQRFAISAGTSGEGKHLPLSREKLVSDKRFMRKVASSYLKQRKNVFKLAGRHLSLPGSVETSGSLMLGEISGFTARQAPFWLKPFQLISPGKLTTLSFREKFNLVLEKSLSADIRVITAVPSWILTLFQQALQKTGAEHIGQLWPRLRLIIGGGVKLSNYRPSLEELCGNLRPDFIETYGASEGYFAYSDRLDRKDLKLVTDNGVFYEFVPHPLRDEEAVGIQDTVPLWELKKGVPYGMIVSTNAGLWRYAVRDILEFTSVNPPRLLVKGRLNEMLDDFGEALYIFEAEKALKKVTVEMHVTHGTFAIRPQHRSASEIPHHCWFIQFDEPLHTQTLDRMAGKIDAFLQKTNRHYSIRRESQALGMPEVKSITQSDINRWLERNQKEKAQGKFPRILPPDASSSL